MARIQLPRIRNENTRAPDAVGRSRGARLGTALFWTVGGALHFVIRDSSSHSCRPNWDAGEKNQHAHTCRITRVHFLPRR